MNADHTYTPSFTGGNCLSADMMRQYLEGTLPRKSLHGVEKHLLDCDFCSNVIEDMDVSDNAEAAVEAISGRVNLRIAERIGAAPVARPRFGFKTFAVCSAALLMLGLGYWKYRGGTATESVPAPLSVQPQAVPDVKTPEPVADKPVAPANPAPKADEFVLRKATPAPAAGNASPSAAVATVTTPPSAPLPAAENKSIPVTAPASTAETPAESNLEKENYADLQIVSARVLQKMTKNEGSSRTKSRKNGQLVAPRDRGGAAFLLEDMPEYPGGDAALEEYLASHFKNPVKDKRSLTGKAVGVMFTVSSRGAVSDVEITKSISPELDVEIIRLISSMPAWSPGKHKGDITCVLAVTVR